MKRGDVVLARYPFASGSGGKQRPCVVLQNDNDNSKLNNVIVALITSNLARVADKSHFLIDIGTPEGQQNWTSKRLARLVYQSCNYRPYTYRSGNRNA